MHDKDHIDENPFEDEIDPLISIDDEIEIDEDSVSDEVIEIEDDDLVFDVKVDKIDDTISDDVVSENEDENEDGDIVLSKHTMEGKHSLKYDSIFKGKKEENNENDDFDLIATSDKFEVDKGSAYWFESIDNENYIKEKRVKEKVYEVLAEHTDINFLNNRRKPSRVDFNQYYFLLKTNLRGESFTNIEIFNELSVYFSDNLFNMFKLLDNKWRNLIIKELQDHIGKINYSNELSPRNIHQGTEIEFEWLDNDYNLKLITGVIIDTDYETLEYKVDSYENIYNVKMSDIKKILNNTKFKYNLNKLNNIDFL
jgi:hypothetical protein